MRAHLPLQYSGDAKVQATRKFFLMTVYVLHSEFGFGIGRVSRFLAAMSRFAAEEARHNETWAEEIAVWCREQGINL